ncbi:unnamed protein product, partial [Urochloa humidicola]
SILCTSRKAAQRSKGNRDRAQAGGGGRSGDAGEGRAALQPSATGLIPARQPQWTRDLGVGRRSQAGVIFFFFFEIWSRDKMVNAIKGLFISCDIPMAQFIVNMNASLPASERFIVHMLDPTHMFVQPHVAEMIRSKIGEFRDQNSYEKPQ